jgi:hypothetical protein
MKRHNLARSKNAAPKWSGTLDETGLASEPSFPIVMENAHNLDAQTPSLLAAGFDSRMRSYELGAMRNLRAAF